MSKYNGTEGAIVPNPLAQEYIDTYTRIYGQSEDYTKFEVFGKDVITKLAVKNAIALRIYNGWRDGQTCVVLVPVDKDGNELSAPVFLGGMKDGPEDGKGSNGPRCPRSC